MPAILVISPHPDDDAIGCGGSILRHASQDEPVHVIYLTSGEGGGHGRPADETARIREAEAAAGAGLLGVHDVEFWRQPDGGLKVAHDTVARLAKLITSLQPRLVYVTHPGESHRDHKAAARLVVSALRRLEAEAPRPDVLMYEVWTPLQRIDEITDISAFVEAKSQAIRAHASQCAHVAFDEAILALNRYRGEMHCWPDGEYAEAFERLHADHYSLIHADARSDAAASRSGSATGVPLPGLR